MQCFSLKHFSPPMCHQHFTEKGPQLKMGTLKELLPHKLPDKKKTSFYFSSITESFSLKFLSKLISWKYRSDVKLGTLLVIGIKCSYYSQNTFELRARCWICAVIENILKKRCSFAAPGFWPIFYKLVYFHKESWKWWLRNFQETTVK